MQLSHDGKEILTVIRGIEKFLIFLAQPLFLFKLIGKEDLVLWTRIYQICKHKGDSCINNYSLTNFPLHWTYTEIEELSGG